VPLAAELEGIRGVTLYYGAPGTDSLVAEYRDIVVKDRSPDRVRAIYRELLAGPSEGSTSPFPEGVELLNTYMTQRGTLYLDWNKILVTGFRGGTGRERQLLASIVLTAADNLPEVERVGLLVDGNPIETIGGHYDTLAPLDVADWR
jgi:spore germination protein GerM